MSKSFTLIELLVVTGIIVLLTALVLPNYRGGNRQLTLQRSAFKLAQDLRRAQEMALSSKEVNGTTPYGFGIYFTGLDPDRYILFADANNNHERDGGDIDLETIIIESEVEIWNLSPRSEFSVLFVPPDPEIWIAGSSNNTAQISLYLKRALPTTVKTISINSAGLIAVN